MSSIQDAINTAKNAAETMAANEANMQEQGGAVVDATVNAAGTATALAMPSLDGFAASRGLISRSTPYIKPTKFGIQIGKNNQMLDEFKAKVNLVLDEGFKLKWTIRYGNPAKYYSSYDGVNCDKGGAFADAIARGRMAEPDLEPYQAAEFKLELTEDVKLKDEVLKAGTIIGYDTSAPSRWNDLEDFFEAANKAEVMGQEVEVVVKSNVITHNNNTWGSVLFELV